MVLCMACGGDEVKGAFGVLVMVGVLDGGTSENPVAEGSSVKVGASVGVSVTALKVGVQVEAS